MDIDAIKTEINGAPWGAKNIIAERYAALYGVSVQTVRRELAHCYGVSRKRRVKRQQIDDRLIALVAEKKAYSLNLDKKGRELTTEDAIALLVADGLVAADTLKISTVNRRLREKGYRDKKPVTRWVESAANETHYIDFSRSEKLAVERFDDELQDWVLKLDGSSPIYKNKQSKEKFAVWVGHVRDGKTGVRVVRYYVTTGESLYMGLDLLKYAWLRPADIDENPLYSIPHKVAIDEGSLAKSIEFKELIKALGVERQPYTPGNKNALGKAERPWRTLWSRFEIPLLAKYGAGRRLSLSELNGLVSDYTVKEAYWLSTSRDSELAGRSKLVMYEQDCLLYPRRRYNGAIETLATRPERRKVGADLLFSFKNKTYQAPERYYNQYVYIYENIIGDLIGIGEEDSLRFEICEYRMPRAGEYHAYKETYREQVQKEMLKQIQQDRAAAKAERRAGGSTVLQMGKEVEIEAQSPHVGSWQERCGAGMMSRDEARVYIARELHLDSYGRVAHLFDGLLLETLEREAIDTVINVLRRKAQ